MKTIKLFILLLAMAASTAFAWAQETSGTCGDNLTWEYNPSTSALTITGTGAMDDYTSSTAPWNSYKSSIKSVILPEGLTHIGNYAFRKCDNAEMNSITIPASVTSIGNSVFTVCYNLTSVRFADNSRLTSIGDYAFNSCTTLVSIHIPASVITIGEGTFMSCKALPSITLPENLTIIADYLFYMSGLTSITIPNSVISIEKGAFNDCPNLTHVIIGSGVTSIGQTAFNKCKKMESLIALPLVAPSVGANALSLSCPTPATFHIPTNSTGYDVEQWNSNNHPTVADFAYLATKNDPNNTDTYYTTFFDGTYKYTIPAGIEAYIATLSGDNLLLTKIAEEGDVLPNNTAVILKANTSSIMMDISDAEPVSFSTTNDLLGVDAAEAAPANCYVLSGHSSDNSIQEVGFYQFSGTLGAHKAYIVLPGASGAPKRLRFVFENTQDIEGVQSTEYRVQKVLRDGHIYILRNGIEYNVNGQIVR